MTANTCPHTGRPCAENCKHATECFLGRRKIQRARDGDRPRFAPGARDGMVHDAEINVPDGFRARTTRPAPTIDKVMEAVVDDLRSRSAVGLKKYGRPLSANPQLPLRMWLQHQYEELLDAANYCKCAMMKMDGEFPDDQ
jgi:hypothetical protein